jgi:hypothetical protein
MQKKIGFITLLFIFLFGAVVNAHSGRTDSSGGHNCSPKSQSKGLCSGYHYHNGGGSTSSGSTSSGSTSPAVSSDKDCTDFATYDEMVTYWNSKGYSATYDPENLDGWGNGQVDDGIPCEAPSGYDRTKINNSPEQVQYKQDQQDLASGEQQGFAHGLKDGYAEVTNNNVATTGSDAFKQGYATGYNKGYDEGKAKIEAEKATATHEGYALGQIQDNIAIPANYESHPGLTSSFEEGFNKAVTERVEAKKVELHTLGYNDGKKDGYSPPTDVEEIYIKSYQEGYDKAQTELKEEYQKQGYEAAFTLVAYKAPKLSNEKFVDWYKEGFESNKEVIKIKDAALALGQEGEELSIPSEYKKAESLFKHYYDEGYKEYEEKRNNMMQAGASVLFLIGAGWAGRRFYVSRKK